MPVCYVLWVYMEVPSAHLIQSAGALASISALRSLQALRMALTVCVVVVLYETHTFDHILL